MNEIQDSVQNRFTAYLVTAVTNRKNGYFARRNRIREQESPDMDMLERKSVEFESQYHAYKAEQSAVVYEDLEDLQEVIRHIENERLIKLLDRLKEREKRILFARVFGEQDFAEIGAELHLEAKQAEMAYYYIIRKLRKELEDWKNEL